MSLVYDTGSRPEHGIDWREPECEYVEKNGYKDIILKLPAWEDEDIVPITIVTPTYNREIFADLLALNYFSINYPQNYIEFIILDDSDDFDSRGVVSIANSIPQDPRIRYVKVDYNMNIGQKRNLLAALAKTNIIVHIDDDDYYPADSVIARLKVMKKYGVECVGCSKVSCYDLVGDTTFSASDLAKDKKAYNLSESTLAYTKDFWKRQRFNDNDRFAEGISFLKGREDEVMTVPSQFVITQFTHFSNTVRRSIHSQDTSAISFMQRIDPKTRKFIYELRTKLRQTSSDDSMIYDVASDLVHKSKSMREFKRNVKKMPIKLRSHPYVCEVVNSFTRNKVSTGKDIHIYAETPFVWVPGRSNVTGSEEAIVNLSELLTQKYKWNIYVYTNTGLDKQIVHNRVHYKPYWMWNPYSKMDILYLWRTVMPLQMTNINANKIVVDVHDMWSSYMFNDRTMMKRVDRIFVKSDFHKDCYVEQLDDLSNRLCCIPNGINSNDFKNTDLTKKDPMLIINTSSPDRSLSSLLDVFALVQKVLPDAKLEWAYGFAGSERMSRGDKEKFDKWQNELTERMESMGVVNHGRLSHKKVSDLYKRASVYLYPTMFLEIDCVSLTKAMAAGCYPITTDQGALAEKNKYGVQVDIDTEVDKFDSQSIEYGVVSEETKQKLADEVIAFLLKRKSEQDLQEMMTHAANTYTWNKTSERWNDELSALTVDD